MAAELPWPARLERNVRILELFAEGESCRQIAASVGLQLSTVYQILRGAGIDARARQRPRGRRPVPNPQREDAIARAREAGESLREIGRRLGLTRQRISQIMIARAERQRQAEGP